VKPRFLIAYSACPLTLAAFEAAGVEAWTCDLLPSRGRPDRHLQCDVWEVARDSVGWRALSPDVHLSHGERRVGVQ